MAGHAPLDPEIVDSHSVVFWATSLKLLEAKRYKSAMKNWTGALDQDFGHGAVAQSVERPS